MSFAYLWIVDWKAGTVALSLRLPMAIAGRKAREMPAKIKQGASLLGDITSLNGDPDMETSTSQDESWRHLRAKMNSHAN